MAGEQRYTVETLASGQPRPYADTIRHVRVTFEKVPWDSADKTFLPNFMSEDSARRILASLPCGFTDKVAKDVEWYATRLDWLRPVDAKFASEVIAYGDPAQPVAAIWEFHTTSPYTD